MKKDLLLILLGMFLMFVILFNIWQNGRITNLEIFRNNLIALIQQQNQQKQPIRPPIEQEKK